MGLVLEVLERLRAGGDVGEAIGQWEVEGVAARI